MGKSSGTHYDGVVVVSTKCSVFGCVLCPDVERTFFSVLSPLNCWRTGYESSCSEAG